MQFGTGLKFRVGPPNGSQCASYWYDLILLDREVFSITFGDREGHTALSAKIPESANLVINPSGSGDHSLLSLEKSLDGELVGSALVDSAGTRFFIQPDLSLFGFLQ